MHKNVNQVNQKSNHRQITYYCEANINKFKKYLKEADISNILNNDCPEIAYDEFMKVYRIAFEKSNVQLKYIKQYIKKDLWITLELLTSSRHKAKPFSNKLKHPT